MRPTTNYLRLLALCVLCAAAAGLGAGERLDRDGMMSAVIERPAVQNAKDLEAWGQSLSAAQRPALLAAHLERTGEWERLYTSIAQPALRRQELLSADRFLATTCAEACIRSGHPGEARELLDRQAWDGTGCIAALGWLARGRLALSERSLADAEACLRRARKASDAKASDEGIAWLRTVTRQRLERLQQDIAAATASEKDGALAPDHRAWLAAERLVASAAPPEAVIAAYATAAAVRPQGRFTAPAVLEGLRWRVRTEDTDVAEGLKALLALRDPQIHGYACLLAVDAALRSGPDLKAAQGFAGDALDWASTVRPVAPAEVPAGAASPQAPHRFDRSGYPAWAERETGRLWSADAAPWTREYVGVQALLRLAAIAFLSGDRQLAASYAKGIPMFDPVDSEMIRSGRPAGSAILAGGLADGGFSLPLSAWRDLPPAQRARFTMAVFSYELYDWRGSREWLDAAQRTLRPDDRPHRNAVQHLLGLTWYATGERDRALACWGEVQVGKAETPDRVWAETRMAEFSIRHGDDATLPATARTLIDAGKRCVGTAWGEECLLRVANAAEQRCPPAALEAAELLLASYPRSPYAAFARGVKQRIREPSAPIPKRP